MIVPMTKTVLLGATLTAVAVMMLVTPILADAVSDFYAVAKADEKTIDATIISFTRFSLMILIAVSLLS